MSGVKDRSTTSYRNQGMVYPKDIRRTYRSTILSTEIGLDHISLSSPSLFFSFILLFILPSVTEIVCQNLHCVVHNKQCVWKDHTTPPMMCPDTYASPPLVIPDRTSDRWCSHVFTRNVFGNVK